MARILFAEDDIVFGSSLCDYLESLGHMVVWEKDGKSALDKSNKHFNIYIFDIDMPIMDGYELLQAIRAKGLNTPCLYLTAKDDTDSLTKGFKAGANDYLKKPFDLIELDMRIDVLLGTNAIINDDMIIYKKYNYDTQTDILYKGNNPIELSQRRLQIVKILFEQKNKTISYENMLLYLDSDLSFDALNRHIATIRQQTGLKIKMKKQLFYLT